MARGTPASRIWRGCAVFCSRATRFVAPDVGDPRTSTREWKTDFAHRENMRELALELTELLAGEDGGGGIRPVGEQR